jgi:hypothetical protein
VSKTARNPERRRKAQRSKRIEYSPNRKRWVAEWSDDRTAAEVIVEKLLADELLARDVRNQLNAAAARNTRADEKRRSRA